jgi:histone-lysine N-methyltransferase SETMAR
VLYINHTHRRQWLRASQTGVATPKTDPHPKEVMLSVWWDVNGIIHWEILQIAAPSLLISTVSIWIALPKNSRKSRIEFTICMIMPDSMLQSRRTKKLLKLGCITIPHPTYSPDLAPTNYHLFRSLSNHLRDKKYDDKS